MLHLIGNVAAPPCKVPFICVSPRSVRRRPSEHHSPGGDAARVVVSGRAVLGKRRVCGWVCMANESGAGSAIPAHHLQEQQNSPN